ncbi:MAG TPA: hypothetical protein VF979_07990 [Streptosporangiaceae bacterium]
MSEFLLVGSRPAVAGEISLGRASRDVVALLGWHRLARQWGLLRSFALPEEPAAGVRACLLVQVSGQAAALALAAGWAQRSGYQVTVLRMRGARAA